MSQPLRILYAAGPGDVIGTYHHWKAGRDDPSQVAMTYSGQFYDLCRDLDAAPYVISTSRSPGEVRDGQFRIVHRPTPFRSHRGLRYHLGQLWMPLRLIAAAIRHRSEVAVINEGMGAWLPYFALTILGVKVIPCYHCVLWPRGRAPSGVARLRLALDRPFLARGASAILSASGEITRQLEEWTSGRHRPILEFMPTYRAEAFREIHGPPAERRPFRVLFAGRIEEDKGVFHLLAVAERFAGEGRTEIEFDLCGDGSALPELRRRVDAAGLADRFRCHGHCTKPRMREMFSRSHVVIVPTTSRFVEGFNQVVAEGVLSGRPVVASSVCPALDYVRGAVVEVPCDDVAAYGDALLKLCDDEAFYEARRSACVASQAQFYDAGRGWGATLRQALASLGLTPPRPRT